MAVTKPTMGYGQMSQYWKIQQGSYMRDLRVGRGLSQEDVAAVFGFVNGGSVSAIEHGRQSVPPARMAELADLYNIDRAEFGKAMLRWQNPWIYALIYGEDPALHQELRFAATGHTEIKEERKRIKSRLSRET